MPDMTKTLNAMKGLSIMVVGDLMLDQFVYGDVDRISPESPVPVLNIQKQDMMLGGAGNVLTNLSALGITPVVFAVVGADTQAQFVRDIAKKAGADASGILTDESRPTTLKTRYLARHQHLLRTDFEKTHPLSSDIEAKIFAGIEKAMKGVKAIVLSDYGKGVLTKTLLSKIIATANKANVSVLVDPKGNDYTIYCGADIVTPNRKELALAAGTSALVSDDEITNAAQKIIKDCGVACVVATRSEDGMSVISSARPMHLKTEAIEVFDVSGAGDTVIATLAAAIAAGATMEDAARLANLAGGIAVSKVGTTPVRMEELYAALLRGVPGEGRVARLADESEAVDQVRTWQAKGLKVGFTNGCFDILHKGHVMYLEEARKQCDRLVVALNHDASVKILKGPSRPVNDEDARAAVLGALSCVDLVVLFGAAKTGEDNTPAAIIGKLRPDIFFKGGDYKEDQLPEAKVVRAYGGAVSIMNLQDGFSTSAIIAKSAAKA